MRQLFLMMVGICALLLTGCATTAVGSTQSALALPEGETATLQREARPSDTLVVVRYPSVIAPDALGLYADKFRNRPIGGFVSGGKVSAADSERLAESLVSKTNFYVMSIYASLQQKLPPNSVVLSPHLIELDTNGRLTSTPLMEAESLPTVLTVDFSPYSFPDGEQMMNTPPLTFGDLITPLMVVRTDYRARPGTYGLLMSSAPLLNAAFGEAQSAARAEMAALTDPTSDPKAVTQRLAYIAYLNGGSVGSAPRSGLATRSRVERVQSIPLEKLALPSGAMTSMANNPDAVIDPLASRYANHAANRIVDALNTLDYDRATLAARMRAISTYDSELADLYLSSTVNPDVAERLLFAEQLLEAERKYVAAQSDALFEGSVEGERGRLMREIIAAEWKALEERRRLAQQQNASTAIAILAIAGAAAAASSDNPNVSQNVTSLAIAGAAVAATNAVRANQQSRSIGINTMSALSTAFEEQISVQLDLIEGTEEITAASFADFRDQLTGLYVDQIGDIALTAEICAFGDGGIWTGTCENGLATGRGRGVIQGSDGTIFEYYGDAASGQASGTGLMLVSGGGLMTAYEGQFEDGRVNGAATVYRAGRAPTAQRFANGSAQTGAPSVAPPKLFATPSNTGS